MPQGNPDPRINAQQLRLFEELMPSSLRGHTRGLFRVREAAVPVVIEPLAPTERVAVPRYSSSRRRQCALREWGPSRRAEASTSTNGEKRPGFSFCPLFSDNCRTQYAC